MQTELSDVFEGVQCFKGIFSLQVKENSKHYQASAKLVAYILLEPFKEELDTLQEQNFTAPVGVDETLE